MKIIKLKKDNVNQIIKEAKKILEKDGLVVFPFDTVYGLMANALSDKAVEKIYQFKGRRFGKGISIAVKNKKEIEKFAFLNEKQRELINTLLPGPFTIVLKSKHKASRLLEPEDGTIGIRIPRYPLLQKLTKNLPFPVTATSANLSGKGPHHQIEAFLKTLSGSKKLLLDLIVDAGKLPSRSPSTVIRLVDNQIDILRQGTFNPRFIKSYSSSSPEETKVIAQKIYQQFFLPSLSKTAVVVILHGNLGVGKTVFAQGIGALWKEQLISPTFVLIDEREIGNSVLKRLYHIDLYRLESEKEIEDLQLEKFAKRGNLLLIEWGNKLSSFAKLKKQKTKFFLVKIKDKGKRKRKIFLYQI
ncbi:threonylcarbamoyl-AMP synthase [bacterium]|nr:threonylcarbamoyl-AMP synthase [bacterium]